MGSGTPLLYAHSNLSIPSLGTIEQPVAYPLVKESHGSFGLGVLVKCVECMAYVAWGGLAHQINHGSHIRLPDGVTYRLQTMVATIGWTYSLSTARRDT